MWLKLRIKSVCHVFRLQVLVHFTPVATFLQAVKLANMYKLHASLQTLTDNTILILLTTLFFCYLQPYVLKSARMEAHVQLQTPALALVDGLGAHAVTVCDSMHL